MSCCTLHKKMKFSIKDFFSKCDQILKTAVENRFRLFIDSNPVQGVSQICYSKNL